MEVCNTYIITISELSNILSNNLDMYINII